jgi:TPR repeat protein
MARQQKDNDIFLNHQDKVNAEIFHAIEALGRRLEKTEIVRDDVAARVADLESGAELDQDSGKFFLPLAIDPSQLPDTWSPEAQPARSKTATLTSVLSFFVATTALAVALMQQPASKEFVTRTEFAKLNTAQSTEVAFAPEWQTLDQLKARDKTDRAVARLAESMERHEQLLAELQQRQAKTEDMYARVLAELKNVRTDDFVAAAAPQPEETVAETAAVAELIAPVPEEYIETVVAEEPAPVEEIVVAVQDAPVEQPAPVKPQAVKQPVQEAAPVQEATTETLWLAHAEDTVTLPPQQMPAVEKPLQAEKLAVTPPQPAPQPLQQPVMADAAAMTAQAEQAAAIAPAAGTGDQRITMKNLDRIAADASLPTELQDLEARAFSGDAAAQHDLGALYASGRVVPTNFRRAAYWFVKAAENGVANAHYNLGVMYHQGLGLRRDMTQAMYWYREAAAFDHPEALYNLGIAYVEGIGVKADVKQGMGYLEHAARLGVAQAAYNMGVLYEGRFAGNGADSRDKAIAWYDKAGKLGFAEATASADRLRGRRVIAMPATNALDLPENLNAIETAAGGDFDLPPPVALVEEGSTDGPGYTPEVQKQLVSRVQRMLIDMGMLPKNRPLGDLDAQTADAIRAFQKKAGLAVDGEPSQQLLDRLLYSNRAEQ